MKKKFVGPANPGPDPATGEWMDDLGHEVNIAGRYFGRFKHGDALEVPDDLAGGKGSPAPAWSAELWEDVKDTSSKSKKGED